MDILKRNSPAIVVVLGLVALAAFQPPGGGSGALQLRDEGSVLGNARRIDCVGSTIECTLSSGTGTVTVSGSGAHNLLSATHSDTSAGSVARGDIVVGNSTPAWSRLALGTYGKSPWSNGTDLSYVNVGYMGGFTASDIVVTSTTYTDVTGLTVALPQGIIYAFECFGTFQSSAAGNGIGLSINSTGGTNAAAAYSISWQTTAMNTSGNNTASTTPFSIRNENTFDSMSATLTVVATGNLLWKMLGFFYSGTSGTSTFAVRARSEAGSPSFIAIGVGSYCLFTRQG